MGSESVLISGPYHICLASLSIGSLVQLLLVVSPMATDGGTHIVRRVWVGLGWGCPLDGEWPWQTLELTSNF